MFSVNWRLFPTFGRGDLSNLVLPTLALTIYPLDYTRSPDAIASMLEVLNETYIQTARAKGLVAETRDRRSCAAQRAYPGRDHSRLADSLASSAVPPSSKPYSPGLASAGWPCSLSAAATIRLFRASCCCQPSPFRPSTWPSTRSTSCSIRASASDSLSTTMASELDVSRRPDRNLKADAGNRLRVAVRDLVAAQQQLQP